MAKPRPEITKTNHDSKGNPGKWNQRGDGSWVFVAAKGPGDSPVPGAWAAAPPAPNVDWRDSVYNSEESGITKGLESLKGYLAGNLTSLGQNLGISYDPNPTGDNPFGFSNARIADDVDVSNPFSQAALMKRTWLQNQKGNTNSMAARGQLRSGALQNAQNRTGFEFEQGKDSLIKNFNGGVGGLLGQWTQAGGAAEDQRRQIVRAAIERAQGRY